MKLIDFKNLGPRKGINYSRDHLRRKVRAGEFPKPIALSDRRIAWREDEVDEWLASRPRRGSGDPSTAPERAIATTTPASQEGRGRSVPLGSPATDTR